MIRALAIKELRESAGLAVLAALGMGWMILQIMGFNNGGFAFLHDDFANMASFVFGGLAIGLGLKQTAWEHGHSTFYFLLHRPIKRWQVVATKLAVGLVLMLSVLALSIVWYGWWASIPGKRAVPFEWSMSLDAWKLNLTLPIVYLGAFLSGMRPGQWFGTRLVPLAATIVWTIFCSMVPFWWLTAPLVLLGYVVTLTAIMYYTQTSDY